MKRLIEGYLKFKEVAFPERKDHFHLLAEIQSPEVLFITCSDSRIVPDLILQTEPGDLFIIRNAGNVVPPIHGVAGGVSATIEYAVQVLNVRHVIICGHSDCGALKVVVEHRDLSGMPHVANWLKHVEDAWKYHDPSNDDGDIKARHAALIHANVIAQLHNLKTHPEIERGLATGALEVHGWYYDILSGSIEEYDETTNHFVPLEERHSDQTEKSAES